jgi:hypothetical protein
MAFRYSKTDNTAIDEKAAIKVEQDMTFYDMTDVSLRLTDLLSGQNWTFHIKTTKEPVTYETPTGQHTSLLDVAATLPRRKVELIVSELIAARRARGRPTEIAEAFEAIREGTFVLVAQGGAMLKFVPELKVTWEQ